MCAKDFRSAAWQQLKGKWGVSVLVFLVYTLIAVLANVTGFGSIFMFIFGGAFEFGLASFALGISRTRIGWLEDLFDGFRTGLGTNIVAGILTSLYITLWSLLLVVPGIIKRYSYAMTFYILADNPDMAASDAITYSREMMNGNKWRLFCLDFSFIGWILLSVLTCGILLFWVAPYMAVARAQFYDSLKSEWEDDANATYEGDTAENG